MNGSPDGRSIIYVVVLVLCVKFKVRFAERIGSFQPFYLVLYSVPHLQFSLPDLVSQLSTGNTQPLICLFSRFHLLPSLHAILITHSILALSLGYYTLYSQAK